MQFSVPREKAWNVLENARDVEYVMNFVPAMLRFMGYNIRV